MASNDPVNILFKKKIIIKTFFITAIMINIIMQVHPFKYQYQNIKHLFL